MEGLEIRCTLFSFTHLVRNLCVNVSVLPNFLPNFQDQFGSIFQGTDSYSKTPIVHDQFESFFACKSMPKYNPKVHSSDQSISLPESSHEDKSPMFHFMLHL